MIMEQLVDEIAALRRRLGDAVCIMGHHYQNDAVVAFCDVTGDSLELARRVPDIRARHIIFCGVHFMGESAALLASPQQSVHVPAPDADCEMARMAPAAQARAVLERLRALGRNVTPLAYVNTTLALKAVVGEFGGAVCTSANAPAMLRWALEQGCREAVILGALGGQRLDHTMASLSTGLYLAKQGVQVLLADERTEVRYLLAGQSLELERGDWGYFSLFPLEGPAHGLTVKGAYYELEDSSLTPDFPLGVSNEFVSDKVFLSLREGSLGVFLVKAD